MNYLSFTHLGKVRVHQLLLYQFLILSLTDSVSLSSWGCCGQSSSWHSSTFFAVTRTPHSVHPSTGCPLLLPPIVFRTLGDSGYSSGSRSPFRLLFARVVLFVPLC